MQYTQTHTVVSQGIPSEHHDEKVNKKSKELQAFATHTHFAIEPQTREFVYVTVLFYKV